MELLEQRLALVSFALQPVPCFGGSAVSAGTLRASCCPLLLEQECPGLQRLAGHFALHRLLVKLPASLRELQSSLLGS